MQINLVTTRINEDLAVDQLVRSRYQREINNLQGKGFIYLRSYSETQFPFSLILLTPIYINMRAKSEIISIVSPLRVKAYYPLMVHPETGSIALINGLNTKFYTQFTDGTLIISVNSQTQPIYDVKLNLFKTGFPGSEGDAWEKHLAWMGVYLKDGKQQMQRTGFEEYCAMSTRELVTSYGSTLGLIGFWLFALYIIGRMLFGVWEIFIAPLF